MPSEKAKALAEVLLANYPGNAIAAMNVLALADTLERMGLDVAPEVVERARSELERPPSSATLYAIAREVRAEVDESERRTNQPTLAAAEAVEMPEDIRQRVHEMTDPDRKRREREAEIAEQDAEWEQKKTAARFARERKDFCNGTGKPVVELEDGKRICPDCGVEIADIIAEPLPKPRRRRSWRTGEVA